MTRLVSRAMTHGQAGGERHPDAKWFWLTSIADEQDLRAGCRYRLELTLDEGYERDLAVHDNNPLYFDGLPAVRIEAFD